MQLGGSLKVMGTAIDGVMLVETNSHGDERGAFTRLFCLQELAEWLGGRTVVQVNQSITSRPGAVRGLHFQRPPHAELKLVRCLRGRVWDVAVDLRQGSATFLQWHAEELSAANQRMLLIPEGCAHGFQALEADSEMLYLHSAAYNLAAEGGVRADDPLLAVRWPLALRDLSSRDLAHPLLTPDFRGL